MYRPMSEIILGCSLYVRGVWHAREPQHTVETGRQAQENPDVYIG